MARPVDRGAKLDTVTEREPIASRGSDLFDSVRASRSRPCEFLSVRLLGIPQVEITERNGESRREVDNGSATTHRYGGQMADVARFELSAHARLGGVRAFGAVGIAEGRGRGMPRGVGGDQSEIRRVDIEDRMKSCGVDREAADPSVVENTAIRVGGLRPRPGR
jgi:hypothetical protein